MSLNYEIIGKLTEYGFIEHKIFISCKPELQTIKPNLDSVGDDNTPIQ